MEKRDDLGNLTFVRVLTKLMWLRWGTNGGSCGQSNESLGSTKDWGYFANYSTLSFSIITSVHGLSPKTSHSKCSSYCWIRPPLQTFFNTYRETWGHCLAWTVWWHWESTRETYSRRWGASSFLASPHRHSAEWSATGVCGGDGGVG